MAMLEDPETQNSIFYDLDAGEYFTENNLKEFEENTYVTASGTIKGQRETGILSASAQMSAQMASRAARGLTPTTKGLGLLFQGTGKVTSVFGKVTSTIGKGVSALPFGKLVGVPIGVTGKATEIAGQGLSKLGGAATKIATTSTSEMIKESAEKSLPKFLSKIRGWLSKIPGNKTLISIFSKTVDVKMGVKATDVLTKLVKHLDDIAVENFGKLSGDLAE